MSIPLIKGNYISTCTQRVLLVASHFGLEEGKDFTFESVPFETVKTPDWKHPFGQLPILEEGDFILYESRSIAKYLLIKKYGIQEGAQKIAHLDSACSVEQSNFDPYVSVLCFEKIFKPKFFGQEPNEGLIQAGLEALLHRLKGYESILANQSFIAGNEVTLADLFHVPCGYLASTTGIVSQLTDGSLPNVKKWLDALVDLPAWKRVLELQQ